MKRLAVACALVIAFASSRADAGEARTKVDVAIGGGGAEAPLLSGTIEELVGRLHLVAVHGEAERAEDLLARVQVDLSKPDRASVTVVDAANGKVVMQRDFARAGSAAVVREEIAHAIQSAIAASLVVDESAKKPTPEPTPEEKPPETPPSPPAIAAPAPAAIAAETPSIPAPGGSSPLSLEVATFAAAGPIAQSSGVAPRVGGSVAIAHASSWRPALAISGAYAPPFETGTELVRTRVSFVALRAMPSIELARFSSMALDLAVGGGADVITVAPSSDDLPRSVLAPSATNLDILAASMLKLEVAVVSSVVFFASGGLEVDLFTRPYILNRGNDTENVFVPWRVRPSIGLGFAFAALGSSRFEGRRP